MLFKNLFMTSTDTKKFIQFEPSPERASYILDFLCFNISELLQRIELRLVTGQLLILSYKNAKKTVMQIKIKYFTERDREKPSKDSFFK